jgi:hypothetical protein
MGVLTVFCDRLNLGSTAALDCHTGQNMSRCLIAMRKSYYVLSQRIKIYPKFQTLFSDSSAFQNGLIFTCQYDEES